MVLIFGVSVFAVGSTPPSGGYTPGSELDPDCVPGVTADCFVVSILPIANGGTGSAVQNFVDLTTAQSIAGVKTFTSNLVQTGATTFSTGTGTVSLNGDTSVTGSKTLTVGTGATTLGGTLALTTLTTGSVPFIGASGVVSQSNANFFYDSATNRLGLGTATPSTRLEISSGTAGASGLRFTNLLSTSTVATMPESPTETSMYSVEITSDYSEGINSSIIDDDDNVYHMYDSSSDIIKVTPAGVVSTIDNLGSAQKSGFVKDSLGNIYYMKNTADFRKINTSGTISTLVSNVPIISAPNNNLVISSTDVIYYVSNGDVIQIDTTTGTQSVFITAASITGQVGVSIGSSPSPRIAIDSNDDLYFVDVASNKLVKISSTGTASLIGSNVFALTPVGDMIVDTSFNIYARMSSGSLLKITQGGTVTTVIPTGGLSTSTQQSLVFDGSGNLYAIGPNSIKKITPAGIVSNYYTFYNPIYNLFFDSLSHIHTFETGENILYKLDPLYKLPGTNYLTVNTTGDLSYVNGRNSFWSIFGNDVDPNIDFIGSKNNKELLFKTNNEFTGKISADGKSISFGNGSIQNNTIDTINIGYNAGKNRLNNVSGAVTIGYNAGNTGGGSNSVLIGTDTGVDSDASSVDSVYIGNRAGYGATGYYSVFLGSNAGANPNSARSESFNSVFLGQNAGRNNAGTLGSNKANNSIFIGNNAGYKAGDVGLDNFSGGTSILIGDDTSTGGFSDSIALGAGATNTASNQFMIGSAASPIDDLVITGDGFTTCSVDTVSGAGISCSSDERLKKNIIDLSKNTLETLVSIKTVNFNWTNGTDTDNHIGFLAQDLEQYYPELVSVASNGYFQVNYAGMTPIIVQAIREMNLNITDIANIETPNSWRDALLDWFKNTTNGITEFIAGTLRARNEICIDDICMNREQLRVLLQQLPAGTDVIVGSNNPTGDSTIITETPDIDTPNTDEPVIIDTNPQLPIENVKEILEIIPPVLDTATVTDITTTN